MCENCGVQPCHPQCPSVDLPEVYDKCTYCDEPIVFGNSGAVVDNDGNIFCDNECLMDYYGCRYFDWDEKIEDGETYEDC